jgi:hypothetical protein
MPQRQRRAADPTLYDSDTLDRPAWFRARIDMLAGRAAGGRRSLFDGRPLVGEGQELVVSGPSNQPNPEEIRESRSLVANPQQDGQPHLEFSRFFSLCKARKGLTYRDLSALTGLHYSTLCRLARGELEPSLSQLLALARALGVSVAVLAGEPRKAS